MDETGTDPIPGNSSIQIVELKRNPEPKATYSTSGSSSDSGDSSDSGMGSTVSIW